MVKSHTKSGWSVSVRDRDIDYSSFSFLIVDDEPGIKEIVADVLRTCRAKTLVQAQNGEEAIGHLAVDPTRFDLIISDCNMSPINGLQLLKAIREGKVKGVDSGLPLILLTGHGDMPIVKKAGELKVNGFLTKPVSLEKLTAAVNKALGIK